MSAFETAVKSSDSSLPSLPLMGVKRRVSSPSEYSHQVHLMSDMKEEEEEKEEKMAHRILIMLWSFLSFNPDAQRHYIIFFF